MKFFLYLLLLLLNNCYSLNVFVKTKSLVLDIPKTKPINKPQFTNVIESNVVNTENKLNPALDDRLDFPMWKVIIFGNKNYIKKDVIQKIKKIIPSKSHYDCVKSYNKAQKEGSCQVTLAPQEHAEFYVFELMNNYPVINSACKPNY